MKDDLNEDDILKAIDGMLLAEWGDPEVFIQSIRRGNVIWFREPDTQSIFKITVEEKARDQWPDFLDGA